MSQLQDRIASMVHAFGDDWHKNAVRALAQDVGVLEARFAALEGQMSEMRSDALKARFDEEWAHRNAVPIHRRGEVWVAEHFDGHRTLDAEDTTIASALRALREKVEGGAR